MVPQEKWNRYPPPSKFHRSADGRMGSTGHTGTGDGSNLRYAIALILALFRKIRPKIISEISHPVWADRPPALSTVNDRNRFPSQFPAMRRFSYRDQPGACFDRLVVGNDHIAARSYPIPPDRATSPGGHRVPCIHPYPAKAPISTKAYHQRYRDTLHGAVIFEFFPCFKAALAPPPSTSFQFLAYPAPGHFAASSFLLNSDSSWHYLTVQAGKLRRQF